MFQVVNARPHRLRQLRGAGAAVHKARRPRAAHGSDGAVARVQQLDALVVAATEWGGVGGRTAIKW